MNRIQSTGIEQCKNKQDYTAFVQVEDKKKYIVSKYNPREEALKKIENYQQSNHTLWIIVGYKMGYMIDEIIACQGDDANILLVEFDQVFFDRQVEVTKDVYEKMQTCPNIHIVVGEEMAVIKGAIRNKVALQNVSVINMDLCKVYKTCYEELCTVILKEVRDRQNNIIINNNTLKNLSEMALRNTLANRENIIKKYHDIRNLKGVYQGMPAIMVGAGPSLAKNVHLLKAFKGIIFVVGRALDAVLKVGVTPDFIVTIDPKEVIYDILQGNTETTIPLIAVTSTTPAIIEETKGPVYFINHYANELFGMDIETWPIGGSVSTSALYAAGYMGCNEITMIGQDLAYTDGKIHAQQCMIEKENNVIDASDKVFKPVKGYYGEPVLSKATFDMFRAWIENYIQYASDIKFINATEGGAWIEGAEHKPFAEVIQEQQSKDAAHKYRINHKKYEEAEVEAKLIETKQRILERIDTLEILIEATKQGERKATQLIDEYKQYKGIRGNKIRAIITKIEKVDKTLLETTYTEEINELFSQAYSRYQLDAQYHGVWNETQMQKDERTSILTCKLYQTLHQTFKEMRDLLKEGIAYGEHDA